jgi:hypothetical protein
LTSSLLDFFAGAASADGTGRVVWAIHAWPGSQPPRPSQRAIRPVGTAWLGRTTVATPIERSSGDLGELMGFIRNKGSCPKTSGKTGEKPCGSCREIGGGTAASAAGRSNLLDSQGVATGRSGTTGAGHRFPDMSQPCF